MLGFNVLSISFNIHGSDFVCLCVSEKTGELCVGVAECGGTFGGSGHSSQVFHAAPPSRLTFLCLCTQAGL